MNFLSTSLTKRATAGAIGSCFIPPQNGVVEGTMHYGSGNATPVMARASSIDTQNGNLASIDTPSRPKMLEVTSLSKNASHRGFKNILDDIGGDNDDGSLPCTPELMDSDMPSCPAGDEVLENDTRELIYTFLSEFTGLSKPRWGQGKTLSTMKSVVEDLLEKHRYAYNGMINKLELDKRGDDMSFVMSVAKSLFGDGFTNWGRVASLLAFGAVVCQYLKETGREHCVELVGQEISTYLLSDQREWLVKNNSWDGFEEFFRVADPESTMRNALMAFAGFAGIGATLALLIR